MPLLKVGWISFDVETALATPTSITSENVEKQVKNNVGTVIIFF